MAKRFKNKKRYTHYFYVLSVFFVIICLIGIAYFAQKKTLTDNFAGEVTRTPSLFKISNTEIQKTMYSVEDFQLEQKIKLVVKESLSFRRGVADWTCQAVCSLKKPSALKNPTDCISVITVTPIGISPNNNIAVYTSDEIVKTDEYQLGPICEWVVDQGSERNTLCICI
ncbi:MAG: hypothetical protein KKA62_00105 [Nanoarchaeota archaeon]|nr:hypothetical protein [Nanoarchaeota archaeon]MBU1643649.1 hypothetical protein [Nanoarchaeota archaeon]MBU1976339.1 hypothetical protein [Nanoarchaeota archaeon]